MNDSEVLALISNELRDADQNFDYKAPLDYYLGNPDGKEVEGRSQVTSTDVADAVEWIMPQIMKSFTQNNEIVIFDPIRPDDEFQAELESQYTYEVLMKENDGFIILYEFVKDALLHNNGFIKIWYEDDSSTETNEFTGLTQEQLQTAVLHPNAEIVSKSEVQNFDEQTGQPFTTFDARISIKTPNGCIILESVAPEDFRINSDHNSINIDKARFTAHLLEKTISDLREEGVSEDIIDKLSTGDEFDESDYRFAAQGESINDDESDDESADDSSMKLIQISECYLFIDANDDGIAEYMKITVAGHGTAYEVIDQEEIDCSPWVSTTAIIMSHKWRGLSIYDRLKEIQEQKTALLRNTFDNIYQQNNSRNKVVEGQVNMDDLLVSRPGGVIRVKRLDALEPYVTPPVSQDTFTMLNYLDQVRAGRSGVSPEGELKQHNIGERVGSMGLERLMSAKEELVGLIVRVIAETGVKPICYKIRNLCCKHIDAIRDFQFRGQWVQVNPATWDDRIRSTVRVGTGTGNHVQQVAAIREVIGFQQAIQQLPGQALVDQVQVFKAIDDFCKYSSLNSAVGYFIDPNSPEGQQKMQEVMQGMQEQQKQQTEQVQAQLEFQRKLANAEVEKANATMRSVELKGQVEKAQASLQHEKQSSELTIKQLEHRLKQIGEVSDAESKQNQLDFQRDQLAVTSALKLTEIEAKNAAEQNKNYEQNKDTVSKDAA